MKRFAGFFWLLLLFGCVPRVENEVVIYAAADREYATPILDAFERSHPGVSVARQYDVESTKTVGLVTRIQQESANPRCDVFWNNEILHTIRLSREGLLKPYAWRVPGDWPDGYKAANGAWIGFAARARVLIVNTQRLPQTSDRPQSVLELEDPKWFHRCGVAFPLFGTTATHFAVLGSHLRRDEPKPPKSTTTLAAKKWFVEVQKNAVILSGNKQVAQAVANGQLDWGLTDTDDAVIEKENGQPIEIIFPDQGNDQMGTLLIPNCVAILNKSPHPAMSEKLADYLISERTESRLTMGNSAQFPLWPSAQQRSRVEPITPTRWMKVDFERAADVWSDLSLELRELYGNR